MSKPGDRGPDGVNAVRDVVYDLILKFMPFCFPVKVERGQIAICARGNIYRLKVTCLLRGERPQD